jgi:hypothetical protein
MGRLLHFGKLQSDLPMWSRTTGNVAMQRNGSFEHAVAFTQGVFLQPEEFATLDEMARRINSVRASGASEVLVEIIGYSMDSDDNATADEHALLRANAVVGELALRGVNTRGVEVRASEVASLKRNALVRVTVLNQTDLAA